jgi:hypothetical protein
MRLHSSEVILDRRGVLQRLAQSLERGEVAYF